MAFREEARNSLSAKQVEEAVAKACGISVADLKTCRRASFVKGVTGMMLVKYRNRDRP